MGMLSSLSWPWRKKEKVDQGADPVASMTIFQQFLTSLEREGLLVFFDVLEESVWKYDKRIQGLQDFLDRLEPVALEDTRRCCHLIELYHRTGQLGDKNQACKLKKALRNFLQSQHTLEQALSRYLKCSERLHSMYAWQLRFGDPGFEDYAKIAEFRFRLSSVESSFSKLKEQKMMDCILLIVAFLVALVLVAETWIPAVNNGLCVSSELMVISLSMLFYAAFSGRLWEKLNQSIARQQHGYVAGIFSYVEELERHGQGLNQLDASLAQASEEQCLTVYQSLVKLVELTEENRPNKRWNSRLVIQLSEDDRVLIRDLCDALSGAWGVEKETEHCFSPAHQLALFLRMMHPQTYTKLSDGRTFGALADAITDYLAESVGDSGKGQKKTSIIQTVLNRRTKAKRRERNNAMKNFLQAFSDKAKNDIEYAHDTDFSASMLLELKRLRLSIEGRVEKFSEIEVERDASYFREALIFVTSLGLVLRAYFSDFGDSPVSYVSQMLRGAFAGMTVLVYFFYRNRMEALQYQSVGFQGAADSVQYCGLYAKAVRSGLTGIAGEALSAERVTSYEEAFSVIERKALADVTPLRPRLNGTGR